MATFASLNLQSNITQTELPKKVDYEGGNDNDDQCINKILDLVGSDDRFLQTWQNLFVAQRKIKDEPSVVVSTVTSSRCNSIMVVKMHDEMRLKPSTWLNDTIIDAFALLISNQQNELLHLRIRIIP